MNWPVAPASFRRLDRISLASSIGGHLIEGFFPTKFFGDAYVTGMDVLGRMHANEFQAQFTAGLNDAHGDFSSVGYEDFYVLIFSTVVPHA